VSARPKRSWPPLASTALAFALLLAFASMRYPGFLSVRLFANLIGDNAALGIAAVGAAFVILSGGIDLSVGALMALSSAVVAVLVTEAGAHPLIAVPCALAVGALFGLGMGAAVHYLAIPPFIATLAGMFLARGLALKVTSESIPIDHPLYRGLTGAGLPLGGGLRLSTVAVLFLLVVLLGSLAARWTALGRNVHAVGGSAEAARLLGVPLAATRLAVYALAGTLSALSGVAFTLYGSSGNPAEGVGMELEAIAAAVVGGVSLKGGVGKVYGAALGVLVFGIIHAAILYEGTLGSGWTRVAIGGLLLVFLALQSLLRRE